MIEAICERCGDAFNPHSGQLESASDEGDLVGVTETGARIYRHFVRTCDAPEQGTPCGGLGIEVAAYGPDPYPFVAEEISAVCAGALRNAGAPAGARLPYPLRDDDRSGGVVVLVPGSFYATFEGTLREGRITRMVFMPHASSAGYHGPSAQTEVAPEHPHMLGLDVEQTDGPFWRAMQAALAQHTWVRVTHDGFADGDVDGPLVPIAWEE